MLVVPPRYAHNQNISNLTDQSEFRRRATHHRTDRNVSNRHRTARAPARTPPTLSFSRPRLLLLRCRYCCRCDSQRNHLHTRNATTLTRRRYAAMKRASPSLASCRSVVTPVTRQLTTLAGVVVVYYCCTVVLAVAGVGADTAPEVATAAAAETTADSSNLESVQGKFTPLSRVIERESALISRVTKKY